MQVDLRPVERTLALADDVADAVPLERLLQPSFGDVPLRFGSEPIVGPGGELGVWLHVEEAVEVTDVVEATVHLRGDLLLGAEDVGVVLRHVADAREAVQGSRELVAVQGRGLGVADGEVAVASELAPEEQHVARAVHGLDAVELLLRVAGDEEHALAELVPVAGSDPERLVVDQGRLHLEIPAPRVLAAPDPLELVVEHHALGVPERRAGRMLVEVEEIELRAEPAVVARLRLFQPHEMGVEIGLRVERRAVDAGQLRVVLVPAPVRAGEARQLERLDRRGVLEVRPTAEVREVALRVQRDRAVGLASELHLVRLRLGLEASQRLLPRDVLARPRASFLELAPDLGLDALEIALADRLRELEVVVEATVDGRPDGDFHTWVQAQHGLGEEVRRRVAEHRERVRILGVARRQDLDALAVGQRQPQVANGSVRAHQHGLLGQLRPDRTGGIEAGCSVSELELGGVGEYDLHRRVRIDGR